MMAGVARLSLQRCARYLGFTRSPSSTLRSKMTYFTATLKVLPDGVFPTMITPMNEDKSVDWTGVDLLTEWYIRSGVAGIFSVCLSSEMFQLTNEERIAISKRVAEKAAGRVPVVAGATFEGSLEDQAELMNKMAPNVDAVVIITNQIGSMSDSDEVWMGNVEKLMKLTGNKPLGFYETPVPKPRWLTPAMMEWAARNERFVFHKDTSISTSIMIDKIKAVQSVSGTPLKFYTAKSPFVKICMEHGGNGFSGVGPNFFPWVMSWVCRNMNDKSGHLDQAIRFISITDGTIQRRYPTSAKHYLAQEYGAPFKAVSRVISEQITDQDRLSLQCVREEMEKLCQEIGATPVNIIDCQ